MYVIIIIVFFLLHNYLQLDPWLSFVNISVAHFIPIDRNI